MQSETRKTVAQTLRQAAASLVEGMAYDGNDPAHQAELARKLEQKLGAIGFKPSTRRTRDPGRGYGQSRYRGKELVLTFRHRKDPGLVINVFTSIVEGGVRSKGADAIRICTEYETKKLREGSEEGFSTQKLVFQRGLEKGKELASCLVQRRGKSIDDIVERTVERARSAYRALNIVKRCRQCSSPMATSKAGKEYCAEVCWKK